MNSGGTLVDEPISQQQPNVPLLLLHDQPARYAAPRSTKSSPISDELRKFRVTLKWCALDHSTFIGKFVSYAIFTLLAIVVPVLSSLTVLVPTASASGDEEDPFSFNKLVHLPESALATVAFFTLSRFFTRYGLGQLLFLDGLQEDSACVRRGYTRELDKAFFRYLSCILLPSFFVEIAHKIIFFSTVAVSIPYISNEAPIMSSIVVFVLVLASWVYRTGMFLLVCVLFRLTCELQILRFEGFRELFEGYGTFDDDDSDAAARVVMIFEEHIRIRKQLSETSHRYRFFIIGCFVTITVSQLGALLLVFESKSKKTFFNSGELVVCSAVQLSGFFLSLLGATRITHRAQGIVSVATRWHMLLTTCTSVNNNAAAAADPNQQKASTTIVADQSGNHNTILSHQSCFETRQALGWVSMPPPELEDLEQSQDQADQLFIT